MWPSSHFGYIGISATADRLMLTTVVDRGFMVI